MELLLAAILDKLAERRHRKRQAEVRRSARSLGFRYAGNPSRGEGPEGEDLEKAVAGMLFQEDAEIRTLLYQDGERRTVFCEAGFPVPGIEFAPEEGREWYQVYAVKLDRDGTAFHNPTGSALPTAFRGANLVEDAGVRDRLAGREPPHDDLGWTFDRGWLTVYQPGELRLEHESEGHYRRFIADSREVAAAIADVL